MTVGNGLGAVPYSPESVSTTRSASCIPPPFVQFVSGDSPQTKSGILRRECRYFCRYGSHCPLNLVGTEASGTSVHMARSTVDNRLDALHVGLPCTVGTSVGVGDLDTKGNALTTIITLRHFVAPPIGQNSLIMRLHERLSIIPENSEKSKPFFQNFFINFLGLPFRCRGCIIVPLRSPEVPKWPKPTASPFPGWCPSSI